MATFRTTDFMQMAATRLTLVEEFDFIKRQFIAIYMVVAIEELFIKQIMAITFIFATIITAAVAA